MRKYPAMRFSQNGAELFSLIVPAGDLLELTQVDIWDPDLEIDDPEEYIQKQGYQRSPVPRHFRKVSSYLSKQGAMLPTNILLCARDGLTYRVQDAEQGLGTVELGAGPLWVVDGQHRLKGIRYAIEEQGKVELKKYPLVVVILNSVSKFSEMQQFETINSTSKRVKTDLADRLILMMRDVNPDYVKGKVSTKDMWRSRATSVTDMMNQQENSVWHGRIRKPNAKRNTAIISERSFSTSLKPILQDSMMEGLSDDDIVTWLTAFWNVVAKLMPEAFEEPAHHSVQKTPGVYTFHMLVPRVFSLWLNGGSRGENGIRSILTANSSIEEYFSEAGHWRSGSGELAGTTGMGGFTKLATEIEEVLPKVQIPSISGLKMS